MDAFARIASACSCRWPGVVHGCYRGSRGASTAVAAMLMAHRVLRTWTREVHLYITPTQFARQRLINGGLPPDKLAVRHHFVHPDPGVGAHQADTCSSCADLRRRKGWPI